MASTGDLDPHWFGHPGSTTIYPLAGMYHVWDAVAHGGPVFSSDARVWRTGSRPIPGDFYLIGRLWSIAFAIAAIPLVFLLGRRCFSTAVGLAGAALWAVIPLAVSYGRVVRTDSAGVFFALLSLLLIVRLLDRASLRDHLVAGLAVGVGISSRYFLVTLLAALVAAGVIALRRARARRIGPGHRGRRRGRDRRVRVDDAVLPARLVDSPRQPGEREHFARRPRRSVADRQSPLVPGKRDPQCDLVARGAARRDRHRRRRSRIGVTPAGSSCWRESRRFSWRSARRSCIGTAGRSRSFLSSCSSRRTGSRGSRRRSSARFGRRELASAFAVAGVVLVALLPAKDAIQLNVRESRPSTRVVARRWIETNVPEDSSVVRELKTAPLDDTDLRWMSRFSLPYGGGRSTGTASTASATSSPTPGSAARTRRSPAATRRRRCSTGSSDSKVPAPRVPSRLRTGTGRSSGCTSCLRRGRVVRAERRSSSYAAAVTTSAAARLARLHGAVHVAGPDRRRLGAGPVDAPDRRPQRRPYWVHTPGGKNAP